MQCASDRPLRRSSCQLKLLTRDPTTRFQPSTSTNSRIWKGADTITGTHCTSPTCGGTEATTRSMIRNGKNNTAPIWNAALSSLNTYAGASALIGTSAGFAGGGACESSTNSLMSFSRANLIRNVFMGTEAWSQACDALTSPRSSGSQPL